MPKPITITDDDGNEIDLPTHNEVCPQCDGEGKSSAYLGVIEPNDWDSDELDDYMRGRYDRPCETCGGERVVAVVDESKLSPEVRTTWEAWVEDERQYRAMCDAERRMGA